MVNILGTLLLTPMLVMWLKVGALQQGCVCGEAGWTGRCPAAHTHVGHKASVVRESGSGSGCVWRLGGLDVA